MPQTKPLLNKKQRLFADMLIGTLIYAVVLGFFDDYTEIFSARSFSTIFLVALTMQVLTYLTFMLKRKIVAWLKGREGFVYKAAMFFCVWLVMFLSKFVFLWVIDFLFGDLVSINNFFGLLAIIITMTILGKLVEMIFRRLGRV